YHPPPGTILPAPTTQPLLGLAGFPPAHWPDMGDRPLPSTIEVTKEGTIQHRSVRRWEKVAR
ncbi:MAG: hypothetical protein ACK43N_14995, partial [Pirellulaceae bacterium]